MILVTAPTGDIGSQVLDGVLAGGEPVRVIARDPAKLSPAVRERVEVVQGSHGDRDVVDTAFTGADAVFWLVPPDPAAPSVHAAYVDFTRPACRAITDHGVARVVGVSALGRGTAVEEHAGYVTATLAVDDLIAGTGVAYRALANPSFMDNLLRSVPSIRSDGVFYDMVSADRRAPAVATRDIAATAARLLLDASWSGVEEVPLLGPEDLSPDDMARTMTEVLGTPVRYQQIPGQALQDRLTGFGMSGPMAQAMVEMMVAKDRGLDAGVARTPRSSTPTSFRTWCEEVLAPAVRG